MDNQSVNPERSNNCSHPAFNSGCGCNDASGMMITISPTTGGQFNLEVRKTDSIDHVKKIISKKLKVLRERICLLYRDRQLTNGSLQDNDLSDGCRVTLLPIVETGLTTQRPELSVINALESLNESQVNDFLSGRAPLNLTMRLGDHMMLIQLMLSTFSNQSQVSVSSDASETDDLDLPLFQELVSPAKSAPPKDTVSQTENSAKTNKSTSITLVKDGTNFRITRTRLADMFCAKVASANAVDSKVVDDGANVKTRQSCLEDVLSSCSKETPASAAAVESKADLIATKDEAVPAQQISTSSVCENTSVSGASSTKSSSSKISVPTTSAAATAACSSTSCSYRPSVYPPSAPSYGTESVPLAKATRNLTQTLQKLSSEVLTSKRVTPAHSKYKPGNENVMHYNRKPNAILENMEHHGRGIYSGTFSGTLNPALQDRFGRPKKDVSTIIHILNDLLCAEPRAQCKSSCSCTSTSTLATEKMYMPSTSADTPSSSNAFTVPERTMLNNDQEISRFGTATVTLPVTVDERNASFVSKASENQTTRSKMEQLKTIMEERKEKRKEKRFAPYEKRFSALNLPVLSSATADAWSASNTDASVHATSEPMDTETILSKAAVIA